MVKSKKVYVETYGCSANKNNSEIIISKALSAGHELTNDIDQADVIVVNTCTVKHLTEQKILHRIGEVAKKDAELVITGCMVPIQNEEVRGAANRDVELIAWNELDKFERIFGSAKKQVDFSYDALTKIIQINYGCLGNCSFCIVKNIKGNVVSRSEEEIINEVEQAVKKGYKEIYLTSTDTAAYGFDIKSSLPQLVERILEQVDGDYVMRIGMMNPMLLRLFYKRYVDLYKDDRVYKFLHMPVQSGSEKVLKDMNRPGKVEEFKKMYDYFMLTTQNLGNFATDIIVGFPTESEQDFKASMELLDYFKPDMTHVSKYGVRKNTPAASLPKLPSEVVKARSVEMSKKAKDYALLNNKKWVGKLTDVLILEEGKDYVSGRNRSYKKVIIKGNFGNVRGSWVKVRIKDYAHSHLIGEVVN